MRMLWRAAIGVIGLAVGLLLLLRGVAPVVRLLLLWLLLLWLLLLIAGVPVRSGISRRATIPWPTPRIRRWR